MNVPCQHRSYTSHVSSTSCLNFPYLAVLVAALHVLCFFFFSSRRRHTRSVSAFLLNRSSDLSGYDVDGTDQTSLGQFSGRVQQTYKHSVPRFFVPEHGTMFTLALVRFPPTATKEIQYLNAKGALTYTDIAGDPVLYG